MSDCRKCVNAETCAVDEDCGLYVEKQMTNADRIRSMSDEELAEYLFERGNADEYCYGICIHQDDIYACVNAMKQSKCIQGVIAWLKQESTDDHQSM